MRRGASFDGSVSWVLTTFFCASLKDYLSLLGFLGENQSLEIGCVGPDNIKSKWWIIPSLWHIDQSSKQKISLLSKVPLC